VVARYMGRNDAGVDREGEVVRLLLRRDVAGYHRWGRGYGTVLGARRSWGSIMGARLWGRALGATLLAVDRKGRGCGALHGAQRCWGLIMGARF
jgi:hypothetical protein